LILTDVEYLHLLEALHDHVRFLSKDYVHANETSIIHRLYGTYLRYEPQTKCNEQENFWGWLLKLDSIKDDQKDVGKRKTKQLLKGNDEKYHSLILDEATLLVKELKEPKNFSSPYRDVLAKGKIIKGRGVEYRETDLKGEDPVKPLNELNNLSQHWNKCKDLDSWLMYGYKDISKDKNKLGDSPYTPAMKGFMGVAQLNFSFLLSLPCDGVLTDGILMASVTARVANTKRTFVDQFPYERLMTIDVRSATESFDATTSFIPVEMIKSSTVLPVGLDSTGFSNSQAFKVASSRAGSSGSADDDIKHIKSKYSKKDTREIHQLVLIAGHPERLKL
jgi:hypothetical protein